LAVLNILCSFLSSAVNAQETLTLQVHPYLPPSELVKRFMPLTEYLSQKLQKKVVCNISQNYKEHIESVGDDKIDIAFLGPASYVKVVEKFGHKPILARLEIKGNPHFQGVIITRNDSPLKSISELRGKSFAFGDPNSTMSHLIPLYMLHQSGINKDTLSRYEFLKSHQNVALGVLMGDFDAGAVKEEVYYAYKDRGLRDLAWTPKISEHVFVSRSTLNERTIKKIRHILLNIKNELTAESIMSSIKKDTTAFVTARDEHYDNLRTILLSLGTIETQE
jgi:phosphonate transport system substrate-binding protein